jgi:hypothetical protein
VDQSKTAMGSLSSLHMTGWTLDDNKQKITFDISGDKDKNCKGTMGVASQGSMQVIHNSSGTWMKPDNAMLQKIASEQGGSAKTNAIVTKMFQGKWMTGGQDQADLKGMAGMCDMISGITADTSKSTGATKGAPTTINGAGALTIQVSDDSGPSTLYVATQGQPYLLRVVSPSDGSQMDFSDFNKPLTVQAPPAAQVFDLSTLQQKLKSA